LESLDRGRECVQEKFGKDVLVDRSERGQGRAIPPLVISLPLTEKVRWVKLLPGLPVVYLGVVGKAQE
jgi:hypothetical protein